jgi:hypothetical protein
MFTAAIKRHIEKLFPTAIKAESAKAGIVPAQASLTLIGASQRQIDAGFNIINFRITTDCPVVGIAPVGRDGPTTGELLFPVTGRSRRIFAFLPKGTQQVALRNATNAALPITFKPSRRSYTRFADASQLFSSQMAEKIRRAPKHVFLHTIGKTGSVSLQHALDTIPDVLCSRDHFINLPAISSEPDAPGAPLLKTLSLQTLISCRTVMSLLEQGQSRPDSLDVICGVRRSGTLMISSLFQNQGAILREWRFSPEAICAGLREQCAATFANFQWWWTDQFCLTHGFSLDQLLRGMRREKLTWSYTAPSGVHFRFYRIEDGEAAMRECLLPYARFAPDPHAFPKHIPRANATADRNYAELYRATVTHFDAETARLLRPPLLRRIEDFFYGDG